jgi:hypothetical protein
MSSANLYSNEFLSVEKNNYVLIPTNDLWEQWIQNSEGSPRLFVRITTPFGTSKIISVGDPVYSEAIGIQNAMFIPLWMLDSIGLSGDGSSCSYELVNPNSLEKATKIVVKPVDNLIHGVDVKQELEYAFSQIGILTQNDTLLVKLHELGGESTFIHIQHLEPSETVFLDGDTIPIEFESSVFDASGSSLPTTGRPPTPIPSQPPILPIPTDENYLQSSPQEVEQTSMIPPSNIQSFSNPTTNRMLRNTSTSSAFVPFSGKGYSLK